MSFIFVGEQAYENILTTKISRFTVYISLMISCVPDYVVCSIHVITLDFIFPQCRSLTVNNCRGTQPGDQGTEKHRHGTERLSRRFKIITTGHTELSNPLLFLNTITPDLGLAQLCQHHFETNGSMEHWE